MPNPFLLNKICLNQRPVSKGFLLTPQNKLCGINELKDLYTLVMEINAD